LNSPPLPISYFLFPISYFLFPISYFLFPISYFLFPISYFLFPISYFLFLICFNFFLLCPFKLNIAHSLFHVRESILGLYPCLWPSILRSLSIQSVLSFVAEASVVQSGGFCYEAKPRAMRGRFKWRFK